MKYCSGLIFTLIFYSCQGLLLSYRNNSVGVEAEWEEELESSSDKLVKTKPQLDAPCATSQSVQFGSLTPRQIMKSTRFLLWTRNNPQDFDVLEVGNEANLTMSRFMKKKRTKIYIHGFALNGYNHWATVQMRNAYLKWENCNFIAVDWEDLAAFPYYIRAAIASVVVGQFTGELIRFLLDQGAILKDFHVIGFSMGAHAAGVAGYTVGGILPRVTGLDPAYPFFSFFETEARLDASDAEFVDVIHTNDGKLILGSLGYKENLGHADVYPNGGSAQPGCSLVSRTIYDFLLSCSHNRALRYYIESITNPVAFPAVSCPSYQLYSLGRCSRNKRALMGYAMHKSTRGTFYLITNSQSPFSIGARNLKQKIVSGNEGYLSSGN